MSKCPPPPSTDLQSDAISNALKAMGANQKCKDLYNNSIKSGLTKSDTVAAVLSPWAIGGAASSTTKSQNDFKTLSDKEGCSDVFANISQQLNSEQSILCELNNQQSVTNLSGSASATIKIVQIPPTPAQIALSTAALQMLGPRPTPPQILPGMSDLAVSENEKMYQESLTTWLDAYNTTLGKVTISQSTFKNNANVDMQVISNVENVSVTKIVGEFKNAATAQALNNIKNKSGVGANSDQLKSVVASKIESKNQSITDSIKNSISSIKMGGTSQSGFSLIFSGALDMDGVIIDQYAQTRLIAKNIMTSASNLGKSIATDILTSANTQGSSDQTSTGEGPLMKQIYDGQLALSKANAAGAANLFSGLSMFILIPIIVVIAVILFAPNLINAIIPGPLKYVVVILLGYFILARFIGLWPFGTSEKNVRSIFPFDGLAYVMTDTKGYSKGKGPYDFHVDGKWEMH